MGVKHSLLHYDRRQSCEEWSHFGYSGQYTDLGSGLLYLRARYYDPATQVFLSRDPLEGSTGQPYVYAWANPINYVDPTGGEGIEAGVKLDTPPPSASTVKQGLRQLRQPIKSEMIKPINATDYRGQTYKFPEGSDLAKKYPRGIKFTKNGFPDFSPYARATVKIRMKGGSADAKAANKAAGPRITDNMGPETWHHVEDRTTMQLVPYDLHYAVKHTGGEAIIRHLGELP